MPKAETISPPGLSTSTRASSSMAALGKVGKREMETEPRSGMTSLSFRISRRIAARTVFMICWWVIGSGWLTKAMSSRARARQEPPTM